MWVLGAALLLLVAVAGLNAAPGSHFYGPSLKFAERLNNGARSLDGIGGGNLNGRRSLDGIGGGNLNGRRSMDELGGDNLNGRSMDELGGDNLNGRSMDELGGDNLNGRSLIYQISKHYTYPKRTLDELGGDNMNGRRSLDGIGGGNLNGRRSMDELGGDNLNGRSMDELGGDNLNGRSLIYQFSRYFPYQRRTLDELGGGHLNGRSLDGIGGAYDEFGPSNPRASRGFDVLKLGGGYGLAKRFDLSREKYETRSEKHRRGPLNGLIAGGAFGRAARSEFPQYGDGYAFGFYQPSKFLQKTREPETLIDSPRQQENTNSNIE